VTVPDDDLTAAAPPRRSWRPADADAALPALDRLFDSVMAAVDRGRRTDGTGADPRVLLHGLVAVLDEDCVLVRDVERRLIDFPALAADGHEILLCRIGTEPSIAWWHDPESGFAGRRSLADDPPW
jgi:hypothetical protein